MDKIRRIVIKDYPRKGGEMNYSVGQEVYNGHKIYMIIEHEDKSKSIWIEKDGEEKKWKHVGAEWSSFLEYEV